ncbi:unnamed protein product [Acanthoscelides obtectus]|uniref:DUF4371 domain-containing protein n=1 Tax=Acanthoscelides obtectus TaxID=200917 RepID=A0A9P0PPQ7_ACAOB|nr:unnamed protein product [Acanthoscelides obtectus]CAK1650110.1 Zinc finger MYM-type protein 1 [Acanthoscelides obtectus]
MSERKRDYPSGAEKRKSKRKREEVIKKVPKISSFFHRQDTVSDLDWKDSSEARSSSNIHSEIEESQAHTSSDVHPEIEEHQVNDSDIFEDCNIISSDRGNFGDNLSECERKIIFKLGPFKPQGPFPKDSESNRPFSAYYYSYFNQAGIKLVRPWLCYSNVLNKPYCHFCWLLADRQNKSYSSAWVNGVSVRSNFTQTILDHEKSQQHMNASLSYNNWLQGNTIDTLLQSEINSKITFWRDVLHRIINVIITLASCNLSLRGHDSDSGNFMAILRLLSNYDATLKELLLKPKGEINYLSPTIQNEIISLLGTTVRNNIISEIKKAPFLTIILDTTQDLSKIDQLSVVFRYISVTENDDNVPKEIKICESFLGFIAVTDCSAAGLKTAFLNLTKEYGIDLTKCRGQGYDGANVMSGIYGGLQTLIKEHAPNADYVHCAAHALNLVLNDAARHVREISTFFDNLEKVYTFFGNSIKRWAMLSDDPSEKYLITLKKLIIIYLCTWSRISVGGHKAWLVSCDLVCEFLHILESCTDPGQLTSTHVNISLALQVACTFKCFVSRTSDEAKGVATNHTQVWTYEKNIVFQSNFYHIKNTPSCTRANQQGRLQKRVFQAAPESNHLLKKW